MKKTRNVTDIKTQEDIVHKKVHNKTTIEIDLSIKVKYKGQSRRGSVGKGLI